MWRDSSAARDRPPNPDADLPPVAFHRALLGLNTPRIGPILFEASFGSKRLRGLSETLISSGLRTVSRNRLPRRLAAWAGPARSRFRSGLGDMQADLV